VFYLTGEPLIALVGDPVGDSPLCGDDSLPINAFCTATFSENRFKGSFLSNFSSSVGVY
jgi:hypothetical protein